MLTQTQRKAAEKRTLAYFKRAGIVVTDKEAKNIEVTDLGLGILEKIGLQLIVYLNTDKVCAKEMVLFPRQICPEHRHPVSADFPGKEETFRCRWGKVFLYVPGKPTPSPHAVLPSGKEHTFSVRHEIVLNPGEQYTLAPDTLHWFQGGPQGAVISEFSTQSRDDLDVFTDPDIVRVGPEG